VDIEFRCVVMNNALRRRVSQRSNGARPTAPRKAARLWRDTSVIVQSDWMILLERFVGMVDEIRRIGFDQVSLQVRL
jgi:hypothetical protein